MHVFTMRTALQISCTNKIIKHIVILLFIAVAIPNTKIFSQPVLESENILVKAFTNENGLRQSMVSQICQDERGLIWMVTGDGLHYFDGQDFTAFRVPYNDVFNQTDNVMRYLVVNKPGQLVLTSTSSLLTFNTVSAQFKNVYRKEGNYPIVFNAFINHDPIVWVRGLDFCLIKNDQLVPLKFDANNHKKLLAEFVPWSAVNVNENQVLVAGQGDVLLSIKYKIGSKNAEFDASWIPLKDCRAVVRTKSGKIFVVAGSKLFTWEKGEQLKLVFDTKLKGAFNAYTDSNENIWLIDQNFNKIYRYKKGKLKEIKLFSQVGSTSEFFAPSVTHIFEDREKNLWFGTDGKGVLLYSPSQVQFQKATIGFTRCITTYNQKIWAGTFNNGLWELSPDLNISRRINPEHFGNRTYFLDLTTDPNGRLWVVTRTGLEVIDNQGNIIWKYPFNCLNANFIYQNTDSILLVYDNQLIAFNPSLHPSFIGTNNFPSTRAFLSTGKYNWVGSTYGLYRYNKSEGFDRDQKLDWNSKRLSSIPVYGLLFYNNLIWVATSNGLQCFNPDGSVHALAEVFNTLKNDVIYSVSPDKKGRFWITGNNGIGCISPADGKVIFFNTTNNLQSLEFNHNADCSDKEGNLYLGGINGLNRINPESFNPDENPPPVQLISLIVSDTAFSPCIPPAKPVFYLSRLAPHISGKVFSTDFLNVGSLLFSFYLENYQSEWSKPTHDPSFTYRNLPTGKYRLWVKCADTYLNWSPPTELLLFTIRAPFFKTWWFILLMIIVLLISTILIVKKIQQIRYQNKIKELERRHVIEKERLRISKDMHDEVGASLTRISILSELAKKQQKEPLKAQQTINQISEISGGVIDEMSEIIWSMNPRNDNLDSFTSYIRQHTSSYLETAGINCIFEFPDEINTQPMSSELRRNLFLTVKEAMHNIVKHSGAKNVKFSLIIDHLRLEMIIQDDGNGFEMEKTKQWGNGLINMRKRLEEMGGHFEIKSFVNEGTKILFSVSLPTNNKSH